MSERMSIAALREDFQDVRATRGDDFERLIPVGDLLALVEAVEAATDVERDLADYGWRSYPLVRLRHALARLDFGEQA